MQSVGKDSCCNVCKVYYRYEFTAHTEITPIYIHNISPSNPSLLFTPPKQVIWKYCIITAKYFSHRGHMLLHPAMLYKR